MSWSFSAVGKPTAVAKAIEASSNNNLTGPSLAEWNEAKPSLLARVGANVGCAVRLSASGHAQFSGDEKKYGECRCTIEPLGGFVE